MRRSIILVLFLLLVCFAPAQAAWYGIASDEQSPAAMTIDRANAQGITLHVSLTGLDVTEPEDGYVRLSIPEEGVIGEVGTPAMPVITRLIEVPFGATVKLSVEGNYATLPVSTFTGAEYLMPNQPSVPKLPGAREAAVFTINQAAYQKATPLFSASAAIVDEGILRGHRFMTLEIRPVNYNPAEQTTTIAQDLTINIDFIGGDLAETIESAARYTDPRIQAMMSKLFLNADTFSDKAARTAPATYLIIGPALAINYPQMQDFIAWKTQRGFNVVAVTTEEIGATGNAIKQYISDAYFNWEIPPAFVLLVGDTHLIPSLSGQAQVGNTDLYYAAVDGADYFADLGIGRLSIRNEQHLVNMLNKIMAYEMNEWTTGDDWTQHATFMASTDNWNVSEATHDDVCQYFLTPAGFECTKVYSKHGGTTQQALAALNTGPTVHAYSGHGSTTSWADGPVVSQSQVRSLTNPTTPLILSHACVTGSYQMPECFGETWVRSPNGALAFWGASENSLWSEDDIIEKAMFFGWFKGEDGNSSIPWIKGMLDFSLLKLYEHYSGGGYTRYYFEMYNLMGDPEVLLYSAPPADVTPDYEEQVAVGTTSLQIEVAGYANAMIGLSNDGELYGSAYTGANGAATVELTKAAPEGTVLTLTVTGENMAPYIGEILVSNQTSDDDATDDDSGDDDATDDDSGDDDATDDDASDDDDDDDDDDDGCGN